MMNTPSTLLNTVKELVESENLINNPALADDLKALLAKHKLLDASRVPPDTLNPKQTLLQVFDEFIHAEVCEGNPTLVHGLRSALRNYVLPNFGFWGLSSIGTGSYAKAKSLAGSAFQNPFF